MAFALVCRRLWSCVLSHACDYAALIRTYKSLVLYPESITPTSSRLSGRVAGKRNRGAVRMTATGSVTPGMACGDRPVERIPEPGACPTAGIRLSRRIVKDRGFGP